MALALAGALILAGCSLLGARTFGFSFPAEGGRDGLPVVLTDHTGSVLSLDAAPAAFRPVMDEGFSTVPGNPSAIVLHWTGGLCDTSVAITAREAGTLTFTVATTTKPGDCEAMGIQRAVLVQLALPADPARISVAFEP